MRPHVKAYRPPQQVKSSLLHRRATFRSTNSRLGHFLSKSASAGPSMPILSKTAVRGRFAVHQGCWNVQNKSSGHLSRYPTLTRNLWPHHKRKDANLQRPLLEDQRLQHGELPLSSSTLKSQLQLRLARPPLTIATAP